VAIVVTAWTAFLIYYYDPVAFEEIFGATWADHMRDIYSNVTYVRKHYITTHMDIPPVSQGPISPLGNLTTGMGIGRVNNSTNLFAVVLNERNSVRAVAFGKRIAEMDKYEIIMLKRIIFWALHIEIEIE
ncbi:hypothetical protein DRJ19_04805, partial [Candidatus Woesearchaeota archaeon]